MNRPQSGFHTHNRRCERCEQIYNASVENRYRNQHQPFICPKCEKKGEATEKREHKEYRGGAWQ